MFHGMRGMGRIWQGAATVDSILRGNLVIKAASSGLRSLFVGFESLSEANLVAAIKRQNLHRDYASNGSCTRIGPDTTPARLSISPND